MTHTGEKTRVAAVAGRIELTVGATAVEGTPIVVAAPSTTTGGMTSGAGVTKDGPTGTNRTTAAPVAPVLVLVLVLVPAAVAGKDVVVAVVVVVEAAVDATRAARVAPVARRSGSQVRKRRGWMTEPQKGRLRRRYTTQTASSRFRNSGECCPFSSAASSCCMQWSATRQ